MYSEAFSALQQPLVDVILKAAKPDMIFLLAATLCHKTGDSIFQQPAPASRYISHCILLVLMQHLAGKALHEWQDKIETHGKALLPLTAIVLETPRFEEWLREGHLFATTVQQRAVVIYSSGNFDWPPSGTSTNDVTLKTREKLLLQGLTKAKEFLAGAELFRLRKQHPMAAFMLHQSAEQALCALLKAGTGYHAHTHSIDRLLRYAALVCSELPDIFPAHTDQEKRLFSLLQKAYIHARYKEDYTISHDELICLTERVRCIHQVLFNARKRMIAEGSLCTVP
jgi:HEPN domain-containing protein